MVFERRFRRTSTPSGKATFHSKRSATSCTSQHICDVLPRFLSSIGARFKDRPDLILEAWPEVVGARLAPMTKALSFQEGFLSVAVKNATLHSLLAQDKPRIVKSLRAKFPNTTIKSVVFRLE